MLGPEPGLGFLPLILPPTHIWKLMLGEFETGSQRVRSIVWGVQRLPRGSESAEQGSSRVHGEGFSRQSLVTKVAVALGLLALFCDLG